MHAILGYNIFVVDNVMLYSSGAIFVRNDHTIMTAPLPVCSAKLSMIWPG